MSGASTHIDLDTARIDGVLAALQAAVGNLRPVLDEIGAALETSTEMRFQRGEGPDGVAWQPSQRALDESGQTLIDTGRLRSSITHVATASTAEIGTNVVYGAIHQFGGTIQHAARKQTLYWFQYKSGEVGTRFVRKSRANFSQEADVGAHAVTLPARPFLGVDETDWQEIEDILRRRIGEVLS